MKATMIIMMGIQGSGKSEYVRRFLCNDFVRVNLDSLHTRRKEQNLIDSCFNNHQNMVIDNTNPTIEERQRYIVQAKTHGYHIIGLYMQSVLKECIERNNKREGKEKIAEKAIACTSKKLVLPDYSEGFDELFYIRNDGKTMSKEVWVKEK